MLSSSSRWRRQQDKVDSRPKGQVQGAFCDDLTGKVNLVSIKLCWNDKGMYIYDKGMAETSYLLLLGNK